MSIAESVNNNWNREPKEVVDCPTLEIFYQTLSNEMFFSFASRQLLSYVQIFPYLGVFHYTESDVSKQVSTKTNCKSMSFTMQAISHASRAFQLVNIFSEKTEERTALLPLIDELNWLIGGAGNDRIPVAAARPIHGAGSESWSVSGTSQATAVVSYQCRANTAGSVSC